MQEERNKLPLSDICCWRVSSWGNMMRGRWCLSPGEILSAGPQRFFPELSNIPPPLKSKDIHHCRTRVCRQRHRSRGVLIPIRKPLDPPYPSSFHLSWAHDIRINSLFPLLGSEDHPQPLAILNTYVLSSFVTPGHGPSYLHSFLFSP